MNSVRLPQAAGARPRAPTSWVDFRNMGILNRIGIELPLSGGKLPFPAFPIPNAEVTARNGNIACRP